MNNAQVDHQRSHNKVRRLLKAIAIFALFIGGGYAACAYIAPTYYIRYRLTLDVDVDGMVHRGTGVVEISYQIMPERFVAGFGGPHFGGEMRGYAVTVDLGDRGKLYLVNSPPVITEKESNRLSMYPNASSMDSLPLDAYGLPSYGSPSFMQPVVQKLQRLSGQVELRVKDLPMLIRFRNDMEGPAYEVDPQDLPTSFGKGVRISRAVLETTKEGVTPMPQIWPAWLKNAQGRQWDLRADNPDLIVSAMKLSTQEFKGD